MITEGIILSNVIQWHESNNGEVKNFGVPEDFTISYPRAIDLCDASNISMITSKYANNVESILDNTLSKVIIIPEELLSDALDTNGKCFLFSDKPKEVLIEFCKTFLNFGAENQSTTIHPTAVIENGAKIGKKVVIGPNTFVSSNSEIGNNCTIGANNTIKNTSIANDVVIGSNNTIGENGFGYSKKINGESELFPHYGRVEIMNNVHVGNNTCIDRGSLSDTIIKTGVKIDNLVHIAHNVIIGENTYIIACSMIAGSVVIDENCWIAPSSTIRNAITIGKNTTVGLASTVVKNVENEAVVLGNPAIEKSDFVILRNHQKQVISKHKEDNNS